MRVVRWMAVLVVLVFMATGSVGAEDVVCSIRPVALRCEYLKNPLGIDVTQPRLSWQFNVTDPDAHGQRQTGYQIIVTAGDGRTMWNSGIVDSNQCVNVVYAGQPLESGRAYSWQVNVKDENGLVSKWSESAHWTMGPLRKDDWQAKWIGSDKTFTRKQGWPPPDNDVPDPWFRKTFELSSIPKEAMIHVASVGYHEVYVNGKKVSDEILSPSVANHRKRARYVTYDIAEYLQEGQNTIGLWLGVSWSIFPPYKTDNRPQTPIVLAQVSIKRPTGDTLLISTDETWRTHPSPNTLLGVWDFMHFGGELYDANKEVADWCQVGFDDSSWKAATVYEPDLLVSAEMIEPNRKIREIKPVKIETVKPDVYRVDLGVNVTGWLEMDLRGKPGDVIEMKFSERSNQEMTHRLHNKYIIGPSGQGTFRNRFNYFTGRWVQVEGLSYRPKLSEVRAWLVHTDYDRAAEFKCSNELLNWIYDTTLFTFEDLSLGGYVVDCAHRERMGYGGDAHATTECGLNNFSLGAFYTKWSQDWRDVQGGDAAWGSGADAAVEEAPPETGNLPYTAPTYWGGGGPGWSGFCVTLPWEIYERYGDTRILEQNFTTIRRWMAFLETKSKDDMLVRWGGQWDFLGDWLWPGAKGVNGDTVETLFFNNCYWIFNLQTAAKIADVLGEADIATRYRTRADEVRRAVHAKFFKPEDNSYVNGFQAYLAIALLVDLPPAELRPAVWKRLEEEILIERKGHIHAGITGGAFLYKALLEADRQDLLFEMANKDTYPGWGLMRRKGATAIAESWVMDNSLCHSSYLYIGTWFIEGLAGIKPDPDHPGFKHFILKPGLIDDASMKWVKAYHDCIYGRIESSWSVSEDQMLTWHVTVPPNMTAILYLPTGDEKTAIEGDQPLAEAVGVMRVGVESGYVVLELQPGRYVFKSNLDVLAPI